MNLILIPRNVQLHATFYLLCRGGTIISIARENNESPQISWNSHNINISLQNETESIDKTLPPVTSSQQSFSSSFLSQLHLVSLVQRFCVPIQPSFLLTCSFHSLPLQCSSENIFLFLHFVIKKWGPSWNAKSVWTAKTTCGSEE